MAKASMRPEVKAQKMKNNKTSNLAIPCKYKSCKNDAVIFHGTHDRRVKVCYDCFVKPPQSEKQIADNLLMASLGLI